MSTTRKRLSRRPCAATRQKLEDETIQPSTPLRHRFLAMIPLKLSEAIADWQAQWPESLKLFPANILFVSSDGLRSVLYEPDFTTFTDSPETATLTYPTVIPSEFRVDVAVNKSSGGIATSKYDGNELVRYAHGPDLKGAMFMTTMHGVEEDEPGTIELPIACSSEKLRSCIDDHWPDALSSKRLVFGVLEKSCAEDNLVFILEREAYRLAAIHTAIAKSRTWREFCDHMPAAALRDWLRDVCDRGIDLPEMNDAFDDRLLSPGFFDGEWPDWPEQRMLRVLPRKICAEYGDTDWTPNGPFLTLDVNRTDEIVRALEQAGFQCHRDEKLIRQACGYLSD